MCRDSIKGVRALVASGSVGASPEAIASFLRQHNSSLDKEQLGEYLGHHDELEVCPAHVTLHTCCGVDTKTRKGKERNRKPKRKTTPFGIEAW